MLSFYDAAERDPRSEDGTSDANIASICRSGLDSKRRGKAHGQVGGAGEYFGKSVEVSAPYSHGSKRMIVFAILMDRSGITSQDQARHTHHPVARTVPGVACMVRIPQGHMGEIVINKADHQLPMAVLTFDRVPVAQLGAGLATAGLFGQGTGVLNGPQTRSPSATNVVPFSGRGRTLGGR